MKIVEVKENKRQYLDLLLLADEQEDMVDRYLDKGKMYVLDDNGVKCECVITDEGNNILEIKNIATVPEYQGKGVNAIIMRFMANSIKKNHIQFCETNLNLEDNIKIQQQWKLFNHSQHKRRRCFIKKLDN